MITAAGSNKIDVKAEGPSPCGKVWELLAAKDVGRQGHKLGSSMVVTPLALTNTGDVQSILFSLQA